MAMDEMAECEICMEDLVSLNTVCAFPSVCQSVHLRELATCLCVRARARARGAREMNAEKTLVGVPSYLYRLYTSLGKAPVAKDVLLIERRCAAQPLRMLTCVDPAATARAILGLTGCKGQDWCIMRTRILCGLLAEAPTSADRRPRERPHRVSSLGVQHPLCKRLPF